MSGSEVVNLQIKDIINEIRPVVINKKRTELDARHDIGRENKVTEIMELISTKNIDLMEYLESMLYRVIQRVSIPILMKKGIQWSWGALRSVR